MRSTNLEKQAHLLTATELKKRGITRYDAEILLAQGVKLPDPRAPQERRRRSAAVANKIIKASANLRRRRGRLQARKTQQQQQQAKKGTEQTAVLHENQTENLQGKNEEMVNADGCAEEEESAGCLNSPICKAHCTTASLLEQPNEEDVFTPKSPTQNGKGSRSVAEAPVLAGRTPSRSHSGGLAASCSPKILRGSASPRVSQSSPERAATSNRLRMTRVSDSYTCTVKQEITNSAEPVGATSDHISSLEHRLSPRTPGNAGRRDASPNGVIPRRLRNNSSTFIDDLESEAAVETAPALDNLSDTGMVGNSDHAQTHLSQASNSDSQVPEPRLRELLRASPHVLRSPKKTKEDAMPRLRKEAVVAPKDTPPTPPPVSAPPQWPARPSKKEMPILKKEDWRASAEEKSQTQICSSSSIGRVSDESELEQKQESAEESELIDVVTVTPTSGSVDLRAANAPTHAQQLKSSVLMQYLSQPEQSLHQHNEGSQPQDCGLRAIDSSSRHKNKRKKMKQSVSEGDLSRSSSTGTIPYYETQITSGLGIKIRNTSKTSSSDEESSQDSFHTSPRKRLKAMSSRSPGSKRRHKETQYDSELIEQQGWKLPKLTIRMRKDRNNSDSGPFCGDDLSSSYVNGPAGQASEPVYEIFSNYCSSGSPEKSKKKKSKRSKERRGDRKSSESSSNGSSVSDFVTRAATQNGLDSNCFYGANQLSEEAVDDRDSEVSFQLPMKRIKLKLGGSATMIDIHLPPSKRPQLV